MKKRLVSLYRSTSLTRQFFVAASLSAGILLGSAVLENTASAAPTIGTSAAVRGNVFVTTSGANRKAAVRDAIKLQDTVLTKDDSALQILLLDRSTFTVGQNCSMVIDKFVYDPGTTAGQVGAKVAKGAFRFMSGNIGKNNPTNASVSTPSATIGIRGTFFEGIVGEDAVALAQLGGIDTSGADPSAASITILRGPGIKKNTLDDAGIIEVSNAAGSVTLVTPNYAVFTAGPNSKPIGPFLVTPEMQAYLDFFLRSTPNGPGENPLNLAEDGSKASGQDKFELPAILTDDAVEDVQDGLNDANNPPDPPYVSCVSSCYY